jgi:hypothetical protein
MRSKASRPSEPNLAATNGPSAAVLIVPPKMIAITMQRKPIESTVRSAMLGGGGGSPSSAQSAAAAAAAAAPPPPPVAAAAAAAASPASWCRFCPSLPLRSLPYLKDSPSLLALNDSSLAKPRLRRSSVARPTMPRPACCCLSVSTLSLVRTSSKRLALRPTLGCCFNSFLASSSSTLSLSCLSCSRSNDAPSTATIRLMRNQSPKTWRSMKRPSLATPCASVT